MNKIEGSLSSQIDQIITKLHIQPVGDGYIDLICPKENIAAFIDQLTALDIRIYGFTWWCHVTDGHDACGSGGPKNKFGDGWYSEILPMGNLLQFEDNMSLRHFLLEEYPACEDYKECYCPAFWLEDTSERGIEYE